MNRHQELAVIALACLLAAVLIYFFPSGPRHAPPRADIACAHYQATGQEWKCKEGV